MKIGIITEGLAEKKALEEIVKELRKAGLSIVSPVMTNVDPKTKAKQMAKAAKSAIDILTKKRCDKIIFLIDFEDQITCIIDKKNELETAFKAINDNTFVVIKARQFENWLIADPAAVTNARTSV